MRLKAEAVLEFGLADDQQQNKIVREYREEYKAISEILDDLLAGKKFNPRKASPWGCTIKREKRVGPTTPPAD